MEIKLKKYLNKFFNTEEKRRLLSNFLSLSVLQAANYILPLITFPYLVRVLGVEKFGLLAFATATISYFQIITDYGFNLTATRDISIHRQNKDKLTEIFSSVMTIKFILMIISFVLLVILVSSLELFRKDAIIYYCTFGLVIGQVLFPVWFFQGIEEMKYITYLNIGVRLFFTISVFVVIKERGDFWIVPVLSVAGSIIGGIFALWVVRKNFHIRFKPQSLVSLIYYAKEGLSIFISSFGINIYISSNTFILGFITDNTIVGYYSIAEKIILAVRGIAGMIFQATYPYACTLEKNKEKLKFFFKNLFIPAGGLFFFLGILMFIFDDWIIRQISGKVIVEASIVLRLLSMVPFIVLINIPAYQSLLIYNLKKRYTAILVSGAILNITMNTILCNFFQATGTALSVLITEIFITLALYFALYHYNRKIQNERFAHV